jgi:hypothetical protein
MNENQDIKTKVSLWLKSKKDIKTISSLPPEEHFPWLTLDSILFLEKFINSLKEKNLPVRVLEFGSGSSSIYFARKGCTLVSYEHSAEWANTVIEYLKRFSLTEKVALGSVGKVYHTIGSKYPMESFDIILCDGYQSRIPYFLNSLHTLKNTGISIIDDFEEEKVFGSISKFITAQLLFLYSTRMKRLYPPYTTKFTEIYSKTPFNKEKANEE